MTRVAAAGAMQYSCPSCRATSGSVRLIHEHDCKFAWADADEIELAYIDILGALTAEPHTRIELVQALPEDREWGPLHTGVLDRFQREGRVEKTGDEMELKTPAEIREEQEVPSHSALRTIYEHGSVSGCHDNAVFALVSYYEMVDYSWAETKALVVQWLEESGAWDRGGFEETRPADVVEKKRHVYEESYGWKEKAKAAASTIQGRSA